MDRDRLATQLLHSRLTSEGHDVTIEPIKKTAMLMLEREAYDVLLIDPAPLPTAKPISLALRRTVDLKAYLYIMLMSHEDTTKEDVVRMGMNDFLRKPLDPSELKVKLKNAQTVINFDRKLRTGHSFPSEGVVFGNRPFTHLLLSALDRANRYAEAAYLMIVRIENYREIVHDQGQDIADELCDSLATFISRLRRMSDFLGRTDENEWCTLIQRPAHEAEPKDAATRFILALREFESNHEIKGVIYNLQLIELPQGNIQVDTTIPE